MDLDPDLCYRALQSRDARFDGRFFGAVRTTGVYCRPVCPARTPRRANVTFYRCAAAAEEAGYRPCRRCRPEVAPGTPAWRGSSLTVHAGLSLISQGSLDGGSVPELAATLGVSSRHLRRLFIEHLGAPPLAIAQTRRAHFAKKLIDETDLTMTEIAFSAGFSSLRRFNTAVRERFGATPTDLRRTSRRRTRAPGDSRLELRLAFRPPLHWESLIAFLRERATPGVEFAGADGSYRRTVRLDDSTAAIQVRPIPGKNELSLRVAGGGTKHLMGLVERVRALFDLGADPDTISSRLKRHPAMARLVDEYPGLRVPGAWDGFELAVRAILGQQVSVGAATALAGRLARAYGEPLPAAQDEHLAVLFPQPRSLATASLSDIGLPRARANAVRAVAMAAADGEIRFDGSLAPALLRRRLEALPGIGRWTADYIAMRALREPDAFPSSDLALRQAASADSRPLTPRRLERLAEIWRPWRAYAAMYLWKSRSSEAVAFGHSADSVHARVPR